MYYKSAYGGDYLKQEHLPPGQDVTLQIQTAELGEFTDGENKKKTQIVLGFHGQDKLLGLCRTNADQLAAMYGDDTDGWLNQSITLYVDKTVKFGGKEVGGIRIRPMPAAPQAPVQQMPPQQMQPVSQVQTTVFPPQQGQVPRL